ncbi:MAG: SRPBCC domain-containing protein [Candidatus Dormibacteraeota bacterium]|nr:SRPBCC domain-containing protein [Candidatus Dormibacteraeota bacterium]
MDRKADPAADDNQVFKALADAGRRRLLDALYERDGRTLTELCEQLELTRFGTMKHLRLLEEAGLITTRKVGREKLHFLNPVPIRLIHDRWIGKYSESQVATLAALKEILEGDTEMPDDVSTLATATQVYHVFIKASPERIWEAITKPDLVAQYFHGAQMESELRPGSRYRSYSPDRSQLWVDSAVTEFDPPRRLVHGWRSLYDPESAKEDESRVTWEIEPQPGGVCRLTVTHDRLEGAPNTARSVGGPGWMLVLSGLKTLVETGEGLTPSGRLE